MTYLLCDAEIAALSPSSVWRVLHRARRRRQWNGQEWPPGAGFTPPPKPHPHRPSDVSYSNVGGTFYCLCSVPHGYSRAILHWDLRAAMKQTDVEIVLPAAQEKYPPAKPPISSHNGPPCSAQDCKELMPIAGMTPLRTSPYWPPSNGQRERGHKSLQSACRRPGVPLTPPDARRLSARYGEHDNTLRLPSASGFVTPEDMLLGRPNQTHAARDRQLEPARRQPQVCRQQAA